MYKYNLKKLFFISISSILVTACGGGGGGGGDTSGDGGYYTPIPIVSLSASISSVQTNTGFTLTWSSTNASSCSASGDWSVSIGTTGTESITESSSGTKTYNISCTGAGGTAVDSVSVEITDPTPTASISTSVANVSANTNFEINFSSTNADTCSASGDWSYSLETSGTLIIAESETGTKTYNISCTGAGGTAADSVSVDVEGISSAYLFNIPENTRLVGQLTSTIDSTDDIKYSLSGDNASSFFIDSDNKLKFLIPGDYEYASSYSLSITAENSIKSFNQDILINLEDNLNDLSCDESFSIMSSGIFKYCWGESQDNPSGTQYGITPVSQMDITFLDQTLLITDSNFAERLYLDYGIILVDTNERNWTNEEAYKIYETIKRIPQGQREETSDNRVFSKWTITDSYIDDDILIEEINDSKIISISSIAFENATPRIVSVENKRASYFSSRLHHALVRYVTSNGNDNAAVNKILLDKFSIKTSPENDDYISLTSNTTDETAQRFQDFQPAEIVEIINIFEEMPKGMHSIQGLNHIIRRLNGTLHPLYSEAAGVAWPSNGYIEFMEDAFSTSSLEDTHRLIIHEKAHFLYSNVFDNDLITDWIALGSWSHESGDNESNFQNVDGWMTSNQTEFVSAYSHGINPNEDMAESLAAFILNPNILRSRSINKYEFIKNRIMQGRYYLSIIRDDLTFKVLNLFPDYAYPGKVKRINITVNGLPDEDKELIVEMELHTLDENLEGASQIDTRIFSETKTYNNKDVQTFFDLRLTPKNNQSTDTILKGTAQISKHAMEGYWIAKNLVITDQTGLQRYESSNDFGWRMFVNNEEEDLIAPAYKPNSATFQMIDSKVIEGISTQFAEISWDYDDDNALNWCRAAINDEINTTYSRELDGSTDNITSSGGTCTIEVPFPYYYPSGTWHHNFILMRDVANNTSNTYLTSSLDANLNNFVNNSLALDENGPTININTSNPDTSGPVLDLNNINIDAVPTNPDSPNGETIVTLNYKVKDDISGYIIGDMYLRDPNGTNHQYYCYIDGRDKLYPEPDSVDKWIDYSCEWVLPVGSAPGTWGVYDIGLRDRAGNIATYNFNETIIVNSL